MKKVFDIIFIDGFHVRMRMIILPRQHVFKVSNTVGNNSPHGSTLIQGIRVHHRHCVSYKKKKQ